jgi:hypothetical protein
MSDIAVYAVGLVHCSVCYPAGMDEDEILRDVNLRTPTGLDHEWEFSGKETFSGGQPNPCPCDTDPSREHRLLVY